MIVSRDNDDILLTLLISRRRCGLAYFTTIALSLRHESANFLSECGRAKCVFSQSCKPNWLIFNTMFYVRCQANFSHPRVWFSFAEVPAGYVLWCRCTAEIHVLNDEYTRQWHPTMQFNWRDNSSVAVNVLRIHTDPRPSFWMQLLWILWCHEFDAIESCDVMVSHIDAP